MAGQAAKIAVSLPEDLLREIERAQKKLGATRSGVVQAALRFWLRHRNESALVSEWTEGYRRMPESAGEVDEALTSSVNVFEPGEEW